jgi:hypothetical protein
MQVFHNAVTSSYAMELPPVFPKVMYLFGMPLSKVSTWQFMDTLAVIYLK